MLDNLEKKSKIIKKQADQLLKKNGLTIFLKKYGKVFIRGSYELDLMIDGDIDIYVINKKMSKKIAVKALNELIEKNDFRGYLFYDFVARRKKGFPQGYYLGAKTRFRNQKWKIDIWFIKEMDKKSDKLLEFVKNKADKNDRKNILKIKKAYKDNNLNISSHLVYLMVINEGVKSFSDFKEKIKL